MNNVFSVIVTEEDRVFVAVNPDTDVASQGKTIDEALELYLEESSTSGTKAQKPNPTFLTTVSI